jgi:site-specific recombinase XerD
VSNKDLHFPAEFYTTAEVEALMGACSPTSATGKRNRALIVVLWRAALRCEEALQLKLPDLDRADSSVRVLYPKGSRRRGNPTPPRTVAIEPRGFAVIEQWIAARNEKGIPRTAPLFCTMAGQPLSSRYVRWLMTDLGRKADIGKRVHAHGLRHTRAVEARREGMDILIISRMLGHSSVATTERYIGHLYPREVLNAMLASQWGKDSDG